jgi:hypothetical protein
MSSGTASLGWQRLYFDTPLWMQSSRWVDIWVTCTSIAERRVGRQVCSVDCESRRASHPSPSGHGDSAYVCSGTSLLAISNIRADHQSLMSEVSLLTASLTV